MSRDRARVIKEGVVRPGPVVYWMSRDQRAEDNWALLFAQGIARERKAPLAVVFCLVPQFLGATIRQYGFMMTGLQETETHLRERSIPFHLVIGEPGKEIPRFLKTVGAGALVTDFDPLRIKREWKRAVMPRIDIPVYEVDAHNIVPCWKASTKQEYGAYTLRPKIHSVLHTWLTDFPRLKQHPYPFGNTPPPTDWTNVRASLKVDDSVPEVAWIIPGPRAARHTLSRFLKNGLQRYDTVRNDPTKNGQSNLSPYLHFGQISAQRIAIEALHGEAPKTSKDAFLEELIVRRELSDNFCLYTPDYDDFDGLPAWAKKTLNDHRKDRRDFLYCREEFEKGMTHDRLWNAAQLEMVKRGRMHGYMRMYWAKKILEWTESPEEAFETAVYLNDRYELDGRDPNGYAGIAWSVGGVHDRAWGERKVFGKIRYMSYQGCRSKFDVDAYITRVDGL